MAAIGTGEPPEHPQLALSIAALRLGSAFRRAEVSHAFAQQSHSPQDATLVLLSPPGEQFPVVLVADAVDVSDLGAPRRG
jgi:hypothetical protein